MNTSLPSVNRTYVEAVALSKHYGSAVAVNQVTFRAEGGTVLGLIGQNGAGKSTIVKLLAGLEAPTAGTLVINGVQRPVGTTSSPQGGLALIPQEVHLAGQLTALENIVLGTERALVPDRRDERKSVQELMNATGLAVKLDTKVAGLSLPVQRIVEILRALYRDASVIVMDEPTAALGFKDSQYINDVVRVLRDQGNLVIYVSHRLEDVCDVCDDVMIMRDGEVVARVPASQSDPTSLARAMVGMTDIGQEFANSAHTVLGDEVLRVTDLVVGSRKPVSFSLARGEVVGLAGLVGSGRSSLLRALAGDLRPQSGDVVVGGKRVRIGSVRNAVDAGMILVPEDRKSAGVLTDWSIERNLSLPDLDRYSFAGVVRQEAETANAVARITEFAIKTTGPGEKVGKLSGGNQQKVAIGKWLGKPRAVLLLDEPTRGVDIASRMEIYGQIGDLASSGAAVLLASSELDEIVGLCDRAILMRDGIVQGEMILGTKVRARTSIQGLVHQLIAAIS